MSPPGSALDSPAAHHGDVRPPGDRRLETPRAAGVAGLAFAVLFVASILLVRNQPAVGSTPAQIRDFYLGEHAGRAALVGIYLVPFAGIAFLWFIAVIRNLLADREDQFFATVFLGSGLLFVAMTVRRRRGGRLPARGSEVPGRAAPERRQRGAGPLVRIRVPVRLRHADGRRVHDRRLDDRGAPRRVPPLARRSRLHRRAGAHRQRVLHRYADPRLPRVGRGRQPGDPQSEAARD